MSCITPSTPAEAVIKVLKGLVPEFKQHAVNWVALADHLNWRTLAQLKRGDVFVPLTWCPTIQRRENGRRYRYANLRTLGQLVDLLFPTPDVSEKQVGSITSALEAAVEVSPPGHEGRLWWAYDSVPGDATALDEDDRVVQISGKRLRGSEIGVGDRVAKRPKRAVSFSDQPAVRLYDPAAPVLPAWQRVVDFYEASRHLPEACVVPKSVLGRPDEWSTVSCLYIKDPRKPGVSTLRHKILAGGGVAVKDRGRDGARLGTKAYFPSCLACFMNGSGRAAKCELAKREFDGTTQKMLRDKHQAAAGKVWTVAARSL
jgi:hypothetical protein